MNLTTRSDFKATNTRQDEFKETFNLTKRKDYKVVFKSFLSNMEELVDTKI